MPFTLTKDAEAVLDRSLEDRILYVKALPPFRYKAAQQAIDLLEQLLKHPRVSRMPNLLIWGETNNGKTQIAEAFLRKHQGEDDPNDDYASVPVVMVQAPPGGEESRLYSAILREIYAPLTPPKRLDQMSFEVRNQLACIGTRLLIIDEFHSMLVAGMHHQRRFLNAIKWLGNELKIPIVAFGIPDANNALDTDRQIANRFERFELRCWTGNTEYLRLLDAFEQALPLRRRSFLRESEMAQAILSMGDSTIGEIAGVIIKSAVHALEDGHEFISLDDVRHCGFESAEKRRP